MSNEASITTWNYSILINAPREELWAALTTSERVQPHYFGSVLRSEMTPGSQLSYTNRKGTRVFIDGENVTIEPMEQWSHTFRFAGERGDASTVIWRLHETERGVELSIEHRDCPRDSKTYKRTSRGWPFILKNLKSLAETGNVPVGTRIQNGLMALLSPFMPRAND